MLTKLEQYWIDLNETILVNKREMVLGMAVCALAGMLTGMLLSPRKTMSVSTSHYAAAGNDREGEAARGPED